ncbi:tRNA-(ms[2]io[6]A)-hydroxylase [Exilibacterium tricleocarpae]|uniref:tRNA-(Ms[2]io[6]A)-hydroxylase n=1 Tax=Exilibacterium tricleocarpae TaxID=2591008 RepID=A0A545UA49_9GAMM|nr:tRNA-(ms[2]io[6]A)-hydroxylase [Exilibacterium tricleocarpae]TQV86309.1 tRNA-(ms[2]io[6]A)-hydroxylase [Exilibacterium tricleocarpae]
MFALRFHTPDDWTQIVMEHFDRFLVDHAAAEKKASGMAISMLSHYPDRPELVRTMADLAVEEMNHFREVIKLMLARGLQPTPDEKDPYVNQLRKAMRKGSDPYLLDRLLVGGVIEARGCERFGLVAEALEPGPLRDFYAAITTSESRHREVFVDLAKCYFDTDAVTGRLHQLLDIEAEIVSRLPLRAALH